MIGAEPRIRVSALLRWGDGILLCRHDKRGRDVWLLPGGGVHSGETLVDALRREIGEEVGIEAPPLEGPIALVDSIAPGRSLTTKHVVHIIFAGRVEGSLEAVSVDRRRGARAPAVRVRRAGGRRPPPADPAVSGALAIGRSGGLSWGVVDTVNDVLRPHSRLRSAVPRLARRAAGPAVGARSTSCGRHLGGPLPDARSATRRGRSPSLIEAAEPGMTAIRAAGTSAS